LIKLNAQQKYLQKQGLCNLTSVISFKKEKLVKAWIEMHKEDLTADWQLAVSGNKVFAIDPLK